MGKSAAAAAGRDVMIDDAEARVQWVLRLGAEGRGRAEIAMAMGMCPSALAARAADDDRLALALEGAEGLALAWWEQQAREACEAGRSSSRAGAARCGGGSARAGLAGPGRARTARQGRRRTGGPAGSGWGDGACGRGSSCPATGWRG